MKPTSALFEAFLKCPTKCYLRSTGQTGAGNAYAEWVREQNDAYRKEGVQRLVTAAGDGVAATTPSAGNLKTATWQLAVDVPLETETMSSRLAVSNFVRSQGPGAEIVKELVEVESAKGSIHRPVLEQAIAECKANGYVLLVAKLCRLSRNLHFVTALQNSKIEFCAADNPTRHTLPDSYSCRRGRK